MEMKTRGEKRTQVKGDTHGPGGQNINESFVLRPLRASTSRRSYHLCSGLCVHVLNDHPQVIFLFMGVLFPLF